METRTIQTGVIAGILTLAAAGTAAAGSLTAYIGGSNGLPAGGGTFDAPYLAAKDAFFSSVPGAQVGVESFESFAPGTFLDTTGGVTPLTFGPTAVTGSMTIDAPAGGFPFGGGVGNPVSLAPQIAAMDPEGQTFPDGLGGNPFARQATDGDNFLFVGVDNAPATFNIAFNPDSVVRGFGFSITDLGDFGAQIVVELVGGVSESFTLDENTEGLGDGDFGSGDHIWAGFTSEQTIASISILLDPGTDRDAFSFDEFSVLVVPVPPAAAMAGLGLVGVAVARRRRVTS